MISTRATLNFIKEVYAVVLEVGLDKNKQIKRINEEEFWYVRSDIYYGR